MNRETASLDGHATSSWHTAKPSSVSNKSQQQIVNTYNTLQTQYNTQNWYSQ